MSKLSFVFVHPTITLQPGREKSVHFHHPWIFSRALAKIPKEVQDGNVVFVRSHNGDMLGTGYYNSRSQIALRMLSFFEERVIDQSFFEKALKKAWKRRDPFVTNDTNAYRLVFSESDGLPGLIVDRYHEFLVIQIHTLGMEKLKMIIVEALVKMFQPKGIYERSDVDVRRREGLQTMPVGVLYGEGPPDVYEMMEYGLRFGVDIKNGQKTGFFLDQRENRRALSSYCEGKEVLNLFSYSGGFSLAAVQGGAQKTTSVDISANALALARANFELNAYHPNDHEFVVQDVFAFLDECMKTGRTFDIVVVDPPAFVKSKEKLSNGVNAYVRLNEKALRVLKPGGILASASCSSHVSREIFQTILFKAALKAGCDLTILETQSQPFDHPLNIYFPEGEYLKFVVGMKY